MGTSLSCLYPVATRNVLVMKENGKPIRFREGTRVKEILAGHPYHKVIRCGADKPVSYLPESYELGPVGHYFLIVPDELASINGISNTINLAELKELMSQKMSTKAENIDAMTIGSQLDFLVEGSAYRRHSWKPALHTILEIPSSPQHGNV